MINLKNRVALITDVHSNLEALEAIIKDVNAKNIEYIFSLGDLIGLGPNPSECIDLAMNNNIINILGNNDCYNILPFETYKHFRNSPSGNSYRNAVWTKEKLSKKQIEYIKNMPPSLDIKINDKLIALCHFPCDCRYFPNSVWKYRDFGTEIFDKTNTENDFKYELPTDNPGVKLSNEKPIFEGKKVSDYDSIIFGHFHFERTHKKDDNNNTNFYSLNAAE